MVKQQWIQLSTEHYGEQIHPDVWKELVSSFNKEFHPRLIKQNKNNDFYWIPTRNLRVKVNNWLCYWDIDGETRLMTIEEIFSK